MPLNGGVSWTGSSGGPYTRGGVASCLTWGPETRKEITITRPNEHFYQRTNTLPPRGINQYQAKTQLTNSTLGLDKELASKKQEETKEVQHESVHESIAKKIAKDAAKAEKKFEKNVISAVHNSVEPHLHHHDNNHHHHHMPRPPPADYRLRSSGGYRYPAGSTRRVLIAEESPPQGHSSCSCASTCCKCCPPHTTYNNNVSKNLTSNYNTDHQLTRKSSTYNHPAGHNSYNPISKSYNDLNNSHNPTTTSYTWTEDYEPAPISTYTAEYGNKTQAELRMSRRDFMKHRQHLAEIRNSAAEERKELMSIYQSVKADEKFHGASPQKWKTISPRLHELESSTRRQRDEIEHSNRLRQLEMKRDKYERSIRRASFDGSKSMRMASLDSGVYNSGSRCASPFTYRDVNCFNPSYTNTSHTRSCCSSPTNTSSSSGSYRTADRCNSPGCCEHDYSYHYPRYHSNAERCNSPVCRREWTSNVNKSQIRCYSPTTRWSHSKPPRPATMTRSRTIHKNNDWSPRLYDKENRLTRSYSFTGDHRSSPWHSTREPVRTGWTSIRQADSTGWKNMREPDGTSCRELTLYNPGRLTPVGLYTMHNGTSSCHDELDDTKVKVKLDCQPNSDTLVSFRVQSRNV